MLRFRDSVLSGGRATRKSMKGVFISLQCLLTSISDVSLTISSSRLRRTWFSDAVRFFIRALSVFIRAVLHSPPADYKISAMSESGPHAAVSFKYLCGKLDLSYCVETLCYEPVRTRCGGAGAGETLSSPRIGPPLLVSWGFHECPQLHLQLGGSVTGCSARLGW